MKCNQFYLQLHRVVIPKTVEERKKSRYSFAFFIAPDDQTIIRPLQSIVIPDTNSKKSYGGDVEITNDIGTENITAYEHIMERVKTAYGVK